MALVIIGAITISLFTSRKTKIYSTSTGYLDIEWNNFDDNDKIKYSQLLIATCLQPYIYKGITDYYGEVRQYKNFEILNIQGLNFGYILTIQVETFVGSHKPPYGKEIMKFEMNGKDIKLVDYQHEPLKE